MRKSRKLHVSYTDIDFSKDLGYIAGLALHGKNQVTLLMFIIQLLRDPATVPEHHLERHSTGAE